MKSFYIAILSLLIFSCAPHYAPNLYRINVEGIAIENCPKGKSYFLVAEDTAKANNDLFYKEYVRTVDSALIKSGYIKSNDNNSANLLIVFRYGIQNLKALKATSQLSKYLQITTRL